MRVLHYWFHGCPPVVLIPHGAYHLRVRIEFEELGGEERAWAVDYGNVAGEEGREGSKDVLMCGGGVVKRVREDGGPGADVCCEGVLDRDE
jgi:hypothetical protein